MPDPTLDQTIELLKSLTAEANRSTQHGRRRQPYYQERYANWAKDLIDKVITTGKPYVIPIGDLAFNSIKLQWSQASKYLLDYLDKSGEYSDKLKLLSVSHDKNRGTIVSPKKVSGILKAYQTEEWRVKFQLWIEEVSNDTTMPVFERIGIGLSQDDAKWLNQFLEPLKDMFVWDINTVRDTLKVIRVDKQKAEELLHENETQD